VKLKEHRLLLYDPGHERYWFKTVVAVVLILLHCGCNSPFIQRYGIHQFGITVNSATGIEFDLLAVKYFLNHQFFSMKILFLAMTIALFASCNNSSNSDSEMSDSVVTTPGEGDMSTTPLPDTTQPNRNDTSTFEGAANDSIGK
jgi:hypothetical protein